MTVLVTSLASGSSGNALLVQADGAALLVDCGLSLRAIEKHLAYLGLHPSDLRAILLTHEHGDHALSAGPLARRHAVPLVCNQATSAALGDELEGVTVETLPPGQEARIGPFAVTAFPVPHDAAAPVGYRIVVGGATLGLAVDLGSWTDAVAEQLRPADLLIVEANHDRERLMAAPYPWPIRHRIGSPLGHLDNVQAGELLARIAADGRRRDVWLAHLSEQTNSPRIACDGVGRVLKLAGAAGLRLAALPRKAALSPRGAVVWSSDHLLRQGELFS